ncbi:MAG: EamA family transporter, partial [Candidatus Hadarchaeum sp.]
MSRPDPSNAPSPFLVAMAFAAVYLIWGSTYLGIRFATESIPPFLMAGTRSVTAGLLLYAVMRLRGAPRPSALHWRSAAIVGGLLLMGGNGGVTWSEQRIPSGLAALIIATVPMWMVMLDWLRPGGVRPHFRILIGLVMGLVGIILLVGPLGIAAYQQIDPLGVGVVILAAFLWSSGSIYARRAPLPSAQLLATAMEMLAGGTLLLILSLAVGEWGRFDPGAVSLKSILTLAYLIVFGS